MIGEGVGRIFTFWIPIWPDGQSIKNGYSPQKKPKYNEIQQYLGYYFHCTDST